MSDVMDTLAALAPGSPLAELRRQRPDVVKHLQGSDDVIFSPADDGGLARPERAAAALRIAVLLRDETLGAHYRARLAALDPSGALVKTVEGSTDPARVVALPSPAYPLWTPPSSCGESGTFRAASSSRGRPQSRSTWELSVSVR